MKIYVAGNVSRSGDGSIGHPFMTISEAAEIACPGDTVMVAPGIYREWVRPHNSGTEDKRITYLSTEQGGAVITGSEEIKGWEAFDNVWRVRIPNSYFGDYNPFNTQVHGDWFFGDPKIPSHTGEIYLNKRAMLEVFDLSFCLHPQKDNRSWEPEYSEYVWFTAQEDDCTVIYANFMGKDPNFENVEISVRKACFFPETSGINYITLRGFCITRAATQWAPPTAFQEGMVGPNWSKGWIIEDCEISESKCSGISLGKYFQKGSDNKWTTYRLKDGTQTQRDAVCQAVNEGWDKETVGSHIVRRCDIHDCGQTGIVGHMGGAFCIIEDNHIHHINTRHNLAGAEIGGIKLHAAIDTCIRRNHIDHCTRGIWLDWEAQGTRVSQNFFHDNVPPKGTIIEDDLALGEDIFVEVSHGPTLLDHNLFLSDIAGRISTQGIAFVHNLIAGSFTYVGEGTDNLGKKFPSPRYTPYHVPHSTKIAGFMTILHGDARFYNNIFVQKDVRRDLVDYCVKKNADTLDKNNFICGTIPYNEYPLASEYFSRFTKDIYKEYGSNDPYYDHLPVYFGGNAYFNGARACEHESSAHVDKDHKISLYVDESDGRYTIHTNLYEFLPRGFTVPVNTDMLGFAFEPEQRFENPDGSSISFDRDYFGRKRGRFPVSGPFEECGTDRFTVQTPDDASTRISHEESARIEDKAKEKVAEELTSESEVASINANIVLTGAMNAGISFPFDGNLFKVSDMFVKGNEVWLYDSSTEKLVELDCEYGIYHNIKKWSIGALQSLDVNEDVNAEGLVRTVGTLLCILNKSLAHDAADTCDTIQDKVNAGLDVKGISMRFTPKYLKFIRGKKFISLEDVLYRISRGTMEVVTERIEHL
ncbi:MAG: right-handed parallel beta-helix repeat-containing protein [Butyrivibrio sp.]|nr:right-handed parallel beta-helix repeat-containing protein [Butyrivibrio sp.]